MSSLRENYRSITNPVAANRVRRFTDDGTGVTGQYLMTGDYSLTPKDFWIQPPVGAVWNVHEVGAVIDGIANGALLDYGGVIGGLTNGIKFFLETDGIESEVTGPFNFKSNSDVLSNGARSMGTEYGGNKRIDSIFFPQIPETIVFRLDGDRNMKFIVRLNDNFTLLNVHGYYIKAQDLGQRSIP